MKQNELIETIRNINKIKQEIEAKKVELSDYGRSIANKMMISYTNIDDLKIELEQLLLEEIISNG